MAIVYAVEPMVSPEEVAELYRRSGLRRPVDDLPRMARMIAHANLILAARDGGRLVGVARALTDFAYCCYLSDLAVDRDYQRAGVGKALLAEVKARIGEESMLLLLSAPEAHGYYPKVGFDKADNAWLIPRTL